MFRIRLNDNLILREVSRNQSRETNTMYLHLRIEPIFGSVHTAEVQASVRMIEIPITKPEFWSDTKDLSQQGMVQYLSDQLALWSTYQAYRAFEGDPENTHEETPIPNGATIVVRDPNPHQTDVDAARDGFFGQQLECLQIMYDAGIESVVLEDV